MDFGASPSHQVGNQHGSDLERGRVLLDDTKRSDTPRRSSNHAVGGSDAASRGVTYQLESRSGWPIVSVFDRSGSGEALCLCYLWSVTTAAMARPLIVLATVACAAAIAACGSSGNSVGAGSGGSPGNSAGIKFAACMRSHGVPSFPDPGSGGGIQITPSSGVNPLSPAFRAASSTCGKLLSQLHPPQQPLAQATEQLLKFSQCMRSHGLTGLPDPSPVRPSSHSGYSAVIRRGGAYLAIPVALLASPAYKQATAACRWLVAP